MSRYDYYEHDYYPSSRPIKTDRGIKAKSKRGAFVKNWWASRWLASLEQVIAPGRLKRGQSYARKGQVLAIEETKNGLTAKVQGSERKPYRVTIKVGLLTPTQWNRVIDALAEQAIFTAQLLAGEMPQDIEQAFEAAGVSLFPEKQGELVTTCTCPDPETPCKHIAAVFHILGEQFDEDPFMLFRLRGRSQAQILEALRARRTVGVGGAESAEGEVEEGTVPLSIANFWEPIQPPVPFKTTIKPPLTDLPILKRLDQPSFLREDVQQLLGPAYRAISEAAISAAFGSEPPAEG